jgi:NTP pyrophosphatase (non-canonical NTP hydrolase)
LGLYSIVLNYGEPSITVDGLHRPALIDGWTDGELAEVAADDNPPEDWMEADDLAVGAKHEEELMTTTWTVNRLPRAPQSPPQAESVPIVAQPTSDDLVLLNAVMNRKPPSEADVAHVALSAHDHAGCFITRGGLELLVAALRPDLEPPGVAKFSARVESLLPADVISTTFNGADMYQTLAAEFSLVSGDAAPLQAALGVAEEAGEVAGLFKRLFREDYPEVPSEKLAEELGDLIWYVAELARVSGLSLSDIMSGNIAKLERRKAAGNIRGTGDR